MKKPNRPHPVFFATAPALLATALMQPPALSAEIYKWIDASGRTHYAQQAPASSAHVETIQVQSSYPPPPPTRGEQLDRMQALATRLASERQALERMRQEALIAERKIAMEASEPARNPSYPPDPYWGWGTYPYFVPYACPRCGYPSHFRGYHGSKDRYPRGHGSSFAFLGHKIRHGNATTTLQLGYGNTHRGYKPAHQPTKHAAAAYSNRSRPGQGRRGVLGTALRPVQGTRAPSPALRR